MFVSGIFGCYKMKHCRLLVSGTCFTVTVVFFKEKTWQIDFIFYNIILTYKIHSGTLDKYISINKQWFYVFEMNDDVSLLIKIMIDIEILVNYSSSVQ